jgi:hypothetical protein
VPELAVHSCFEVQISVRIKRYLTKCVKGKVSAVNCHAFKRLIRGGSSSLFPRVVFVIAQSLQGIISQLLVINTCIATK